jgi:plasmid stabilization system protein ParE
VTQTAAAAWYAYAVVGPVTAEVREAVAEGLDLVGSDDVAVVVGRVPLSDFGEDVLPARLNDRAWLEEKARAHEAVVQRLLPLTTVVPLRFGSIHRDRAAVEAFLEQHREELAGELVYLRGRVELGVKVWAAPRAAAKRGQPPASGREYLQRRKAEREEAAAAASSLDSRLRTIHERLLGAAEDGTLNRPQPPELTGADREMVLNGAYLVPAGDERLSAEIERLREEHRDLAFDLTGPWAPYNFVEVAVDP